MFSVVFFCILIYTASNILVNTLQELTSDPQNCSNIYMVTLIDWLPAKYNELLMTILYTSLKWKQLFESYDAGVGNCINLCREEPEVHVTVSGLVDSDETCIAVLCYPLDRTNLTSSLGWEAKKDTQCKLIQSEDNFIITTDTTIREILVIYWTAI